MCRPPLFRVPSAGATLLGAGKPTEVNLFAQQGQCSVRPCVIFSLIAQLVDFEHDTN